MEYEKISKLLDDASNKTSKFRTKNWVEINDESRGTYNDDKQIRFKTTMLKSTLCDYSDACLLVKGKKQLQEQEIMKQIDKQMKEMQA